MKLLAGVLAVGGLLALGYWAFEQVRARLFQARGIRHFSDQPRRQAEPAEPDATFPPNPDPGSPVALLTIPRLGLSALVLEGAGESQLKLGPGHIPGTPFPGGGANFALAGHRDTFFRPLRLVRRNDAIVVAVHDRVYHYQVVATSIVGPRDVRVLQPADHDILTLVTCYPFDFLGAAPQRFIVRADCLDCIAESTAADAASWRNRFAIIKPSRFVGAILFP